MPSRFVTKGIRHEARGLFESDQNGAGTEDAVALAFPDFRQGVTCFQFGDNAQDGVISHPEATLGFAKRKKSVRADEIDELQRYFRSAAGKCHRSISQLLVNALGETQGVFKLSRDTIEDILQPAAGAKPPPRVAPVGPIDRLDSRTGQWTARPARGKAMPVSRQLGNHANPQDHTAIGPHG